MRSIRFATLLLVSAVSCVGTIRSTEARNLTRAEKKIIGDAVAHELKDPASATFRWLPIREFPQSGMQTYCGMVNAKNSFGGYTGFVPFVTLLSGAGGKVVMAGTVGVENPGDDGGIQKMCLQYGLDPATAE